MGREREREKRNKEKEEKKDAGQHPPTKFFFLRLMLIVLCLDRSHVTDGCRSGQISRDGA
jgi:hypothetical protein